MKLEDHLKNATLAAAQEYSRTSEKFTYCIDVLEISAHDDFADAWINALEDRYEEILKGHQQEPS